MTSLMLVQIYFCVFARIRIHIEYWLVNSWFISSSLIRFFFKTFIFNLLIKVIYFLNRFWLIVMLIITICTHGYIICVLLGYHENKSLKKSLSWLYTCFIDFMKIGFLLYVIADYGYWIVSNICAMTAKEVVIVISYVCYDTKYHLCSGLH